MADYKKVLHFTFKIPFNYDTGFLIELRGLPIELHNSGKVWSTKNPLWEYKKVTTVQEYWNDKGFSIYKDLEPLWQKYLKTVMNFPQTTFKNYLLVNSSSHSYLPDRLELYIKIWFETKNTIYQ